jgi:hypothetical protein
MIKRVRMLHCLANRHEQFQSFPWRQVLLVTVLRHRNAVDQLHQLRLRTGAIAGDRGVLAQRVTAAARFWTLA